MTMCIDSPWKADFPALAGKSVTYLDSAATCQVPNSVIQALNDYLSNGHGNPGRGLHRLSENANRVLQACRLKVADFVGADVEQIAFTKSTTESINLVASSLRSTLTVKDSILVSEMEHHSNLLPWQRLCQQTGARLNILPLNQNGEFDLSRLQPLLADHCQLFAFTHGSNVLGNHPPIEFFIQQANLASVKTLVDGAQAVSHTKINLTDLGCDYYAFSGHKLYAPGGSGVLYCRQPDSLEPLLLGGGIVNKTSKTSYRLTNGITKLEAGSANLISLVGLSAALDYINQIGIENIIEYEKIIYNYLLDNISQLDDYQILSHPGSKNLISFHSRPDYSRPGQSGQYHCHDIASILSDSQIAVRAGHHCAQPCLNAIGVKHCVRASLGLYNDSQDIDALIEGLKGVGEILG